MGGINEPGFIESGLSIHFLRFSGVFLTAPDAKVSRLARWERSGPNLPVAADPETVWQLMQALCMNTVCPSVAAGLPGNSCCAGFCCCLTQASKSSGDWA